MKHFVLRLVLLLSLSLLLLNGTSCKTGNPSTDSLDQARFSIADLQSDFKQFRNFLESSHPKLYQFTSKEDFNDLFDQQYQLIDHPMTAQEFYTILIPLVARVGCGHTSLWTPSGYWEKVTDQMFPLGIHASDGRLFVIHGYQNDLAIKYGSEILSINGKETGPILEKMLNNIWSDGYILTKRYQRLNRIFPYLFALNYGFHTEFELEILEAGVKRKLSIKPISRKQIDKHIESFYVFSPDLQLELITEQTALLTIKTFSYYDHVEGFHHFIDSSFRVISDHHIQNLIIDLRGNDGGDPFCSTHLLRYLQKEPVVYFNKPYGQYAPFNKPLPMADIPFTGEQYYLINGLCFSTTGHLTSLLKYHQLGTFVGEETGATYTCNDASHDIRLKHTGYRVQSARRSFATAVTGFPLDKGILPDFPVSPGIEDLENGRDAVLEYALQLIRSNSK